MHSNANLAAACIDELNLSSITDSSSPKIEKSASPTLKKQRTTGNADLTSASNEKTNEDLEMEISAGISNIMNKFNNSKVIERCGKRESTVQGGKSSRADVVVNTEIGSVPKVDKAKPRLVIAIDGSSDSSGSSQSRQAEPRQVIVNPIVGKLRDSQNLDQVKLPDRKKVAVLISISSSSDDDSESETVSIK